MTTFSVNHYGYKLGVHVDSFDGCCGAKNMHGFSVSAASDTLTLEQKHKLYDALIRKILPTIPGVLLSTDCVLNFGEWSTGRSGGTTSGNNWAPDAGAGAGDISLENFCEYLGMERGPVGKNNNSGNLIACFSKQRFAANEDGTYTEWVVEEPDFSDDETAAKKPSSADVQGIIDIIIGLVNDQQ